MSYGLGFGELVLLFVAAFVLVACAVWVTRDASRRGKSPFLVLLAVLFFLPFSLIAWFLFRPPLLRARQRSRPLRV